MPGVLGSAYRVVRAQVFPFGPGDLLVMHTDGIRSRFDLEVARALPVQLAAESVVRTCAKGSDDAACAIARGVLETGVPSPRPPAGDASFDRGIPIRMRGDAECAAIEAKAFTLQEDGFGASARSGR